MLLILVLGWALPAQAGENFSVKLSFLLPAGMENAPNYSAFDPGPELLDQRSGTLNESGRPWGLRLRLGGRWIGGAMYLDAAWTQGRRSVVMIRSSEQTNLIYDDQINWHDITVHTLAVGYQYDPLQDSRHASLGFGIGWELSTAWHIRQVLHNRYDTLGQFKVIEDSRGPATWLNFNEDVFYVSVDPEVYPFGKRGLGIGFRTRYVFNPKTKAIHGGTLAGDYEIPIKQRRWTTALTATVEF